MYPYQDSQAQYSDDETQATHISQTQQNDPWIEAMRQQGNAFFGAPQIPPNTYTNSALDRAGIIYWVLLRRLYDWPHRRDGARRRLNIYRRAVIIRGCRHLLNFRGGDQDLFRAGCSRLSLYPRIPGQHQFRASTNVHHQQRGPYSDLRSAGRPPE